MKKTVIALITLMVIWACEEASSDKRLVPSSSGNLNSLLIVSDNEAWDGNVGEAVREILAAPVDGLPQEEPLFTLNHMPSQVFSGFARKNRIVLQIEKGKEADFNVLKDAYARPQTVVKVSGNNNLEIIDQIKENASKIIASFKNTEITEKLRRINKSLNTNNNIEKNHGLTIKFPTAYRMAKEEDKFSWIRKDIRTGTMDIMIYELPFDAIKRHDSTIVDIIKMRDSIGKAHIEGTKEGSYMITERAYSPLLFETIVDNKPALETKGTWEMKDGQFMAGPFINYIIEDEINNRLVVMEGYVFAPSIQKRDYVFELESIIKSVKIK